MYYKYHNYFVPTKYNNAYIPYQTLKKIGDQLIKLETKRQQNLSEDFNGIIKDETAGKLTFTEAIFQLTSVDYLENFVDNLKTELEEYPELSVSSSVDSYLDVKDSVNSLGKLSDIRFVISILSSFIVLTLIIYVYIKNRKNEVGLYIALGELKRNIILQLTFEVLIICLLGFMLSYTTGKIFSQKITNHLIQTEEVFEEYNQDELMNVVEGNSLDQYMIDIIGLEINIIILSSCYPLIKIMKMKPKEVLQ